MATHQYFRDKGYRSTWHPSVDKAPEDHTGKGPKGYRRSDERIYEEICEVLTAHPQVDPIEIELTVEDGVVTLWGTVSNRDMKRMAEDAILDCSGVIDVVNRLHVASRYQHEGVMGDGTLRPQQSRNRSR